MTEDMNNEEMDFEEEVPITEEPMDMGMDEVTDDDKLWALLAYVFTPLIPIVLMLMEDKKDRPFLKAHNAQALAWGVLNVVVGTVLSVFLCGIPSLLMWLMAIYWGWQAYQGQEVTIPVITDFVKQQGWA
ncbi:MAG: DUF4870 domain-containing protein [Chloroflexi bacterium]|nr:DUF4870 domain-containing protein [Chloroflexota bacterium]